MSDNKAGSSTQEALEEAARRIFDHPRKCHCNVEARIKAAVLKERAAVVTYIATRTDFSDLAEDVENGWHVEAKVAIAQWNDSPHTTHADVLEAFDKAIGALP